MRILLTLVIVLWMPTMSADASEKYREANRDHYTRDCGEVFGNQAPSQNCGEDVPVYTRHLQEGGALMSESNKYSLNCRNRLAKNCEALQTQARPLNLPLRCSSTITR